MKKTVLTLITLALASTTMSALEIEVQSGDAFNKVMSKNRSNKKIEGANHVTIKNSEQMKLYGEGDLGLTIDASKGNVGTIYNYVEIKNVKSDKYKIKKSNTKTNKYNSKNKKSEGRNIGIKLKTKKGFNRGFQGKVHNNVKIENSDLD